LRARSLHNLADAERPPPELSTKMNKAPGMMPGAFIVYLDVRDRRLRLDQASVRIGSIVIVAHAAATTTGSGGRFILLGDVAEGQVGRQRCYAQTMLGAAANDLVFEP